MTELTAGQAIEEAKRMANHFRAFQKIYEVLQQAAEADVKLTNLSATIEQQSKRAEDLEEQNNRLSAEIRKLIEQRDNLTQEVGESRIQQMEALALEMRQERETLEDGLKEIAEEVEEHKKRLSVYKDQLDAEAKEKQGELTRLNEQVDEMKSVRDEMRQKFLSD